jgi:4-aminobutyrate aminotransferase-like enzyme
MQKLPELKTAIPGPKSRKMAKALKKVEAPTITHVSADWPVFWERAEGVNVWDVDGNRYIDFTSAFGVAALGHSHPSITKAIQSQSEQLCHAMGDVHPTRLKLELCEKLSEITFERWSKGAVQGQTILCNSGFEAVEAALKTAKLFTGKRGVIAFENSYHGLGYGALETTWRRDFRTPFNDQLGHFAYFAPYPHTCGDPQKENETLEALEHHIRQFLQTHEIGAILVEPFQGRGGEVIPPKDFLPRLRKICDRTRTLLIVDEIYTGLGRTGAWFGVDHSGIVPDIICLGKALTGALPLSACVGSQDVMVAWPESKGEALHTSTFLGNPLACAAALASLDVLGKKFKPLKVFDRGSRFVKLLQETLKDSPAIREIRGIGFMIGIELKQESNISVQTLCEKLLKRGLIALPSGSRGEVLALAPPLITEDRILKWAAEQIQEILFDK